MEIFYYKSNPENFGDVLNKLIWPKMFNGCENLKSDTLFLGIGTVISKEILRDNVDKYNKIVVFGSGVGYGDLPKICSKWEFRFVRGPKTAEILKFPGLKYITDPANLIQVYFKNKKEKRYKVSYMPHHSSLHYYDWKKLCGMAGIHLISPTSDVLSVIDEISSTELLISEAMHGAIVADALRVPWVPVKCYDHILDFKWIDWMETVGLLYQPIFIEPAFKNMEGRGNLNVIKTKIKRVAKIMGYWDKNWWELPPKRSSAAQIDNICQGLSNINHDSAVLSSDNINYLNLDMVVSEVELFKKTL